jgi:hypothetical protein
MSAKDSTERRRWQMDVGVGLLGLRSQSFSGALPLLPQQFTTLYAGGENVWSIVYPRLKTTSFTT